MRTRLSAPWGALLVVLATVFAYSVGAQTVIFQTDKGRVVVKAVPEGKDIRSFYAEPAAPPIPPFVAAADLFTVPRRYCQLLWTGA